MELKARLKVLVWSTSQTLGGNAMVLSRFKDEKNPEVWLRTLGAKFGRVMNEPIHKTQCVQSSDGPPWCLY